jgi:hypothetical protein
MPMTDDGDIIRGIGFVTVYSAYLEDNLTNLIELSTQLKKKKFPWNLKDRAISLRKLLLKQFDETPDYIGKDQDKNQILRTLNAVEIITEERNLIIHSALISKQTGGIIQKNCRNNTETQIKSAEAYELANYIFELSKNTYGLIFPIKRLIQVSKNQRA